MNKICQNDQDSKVFFYVYSIILSVFIIIGENFELLLVYIGSRYSLQLQIHQNQLGMFIMNTYYEFAVN